MNRYLFFTLLIMIFLIACEEKKLQLNFDEMILVKAGPMMSTNSNLYRKETNLEDFYIGKYEVTQKEWLKHMTFNPSFKIGDSLPVSKVTWYECIEFCNKKSIAEKLQPFYNVYKDSIDKVNICELDTLKWLVTINKDANGYRLPLEVEWEFAAAGGLATKGYKYAGSNNVDEVAWYWRNNGDTSLVGANWNANFLEQHKCRPHNVGLKKPNELGIHDMTGNVREWCEEWHASEYYPFGVYKSQRGGGWIGHENYMKVNDRDYYEPIGQARDQGLRLCRNGK